MGLRVEKIRAAAKLHESVAEKLGQLIIEGKVSPGERLPSERELGEQFGVSRTVVREALKALAAQKLIVIEQGRGSKVQGISAQNLSVVLKVLVARENSGLWELMEARQVLEAELTHLAATRGTPARWRSLALNIELMRVSERSNDCVEFIKLDMAFHSSIARAAANPVLALVLEAFADLIHTQHAMILKSHMPISGSKAVEFHQSILDRLKARDADGARDAMRRHMMHARDNLRRAIASLDSGQE